MHQLSAGERPFVTELLQTFSDCATVLMRDIELAATSHDDSGLKLLAHQLKGASGNIFAGAVTGAAGALELAGEDRRADRVQALQQAWSALQVRLPLPKGSVAAA